MRALLAAALYALFYQTAAHRFDRGDIKSIDPADLTDRAWRAAGGFFIHLPNARKNS